MLPILIMGAMGAYSQEAIGDWNIAILGVQIPGWGPVAAVGAALAVLHTNAMNLYPSTVDLLVTLNTVRKPRTWEQPIATVILGVLGVLTAQAGILAHAEAIGVVAPRPFRVRDDRRLAVGLDRQMQYRQLFSSGAQIRGSMADPGARLLSRRLCS
ncbi:hypothetical protein IFM12275_24270 [Nocardia sputorum]|uniref:hypothetical protein n=1 Tax=Nocardia sputorum TaxID=2984338 RepID=UPI002492E855|nr:hypothetical protein [Nocardia sputorum]BDT92451.1 hypothetical protein IFM12275_24270 [Nocardia sputorum]